MPRIRTLFAIVSAAWFLIGLLMPHFAPSQGVTITTPHATSAVFYSPQVPCYDLAALFAVFACLYSLGSIRFSRTLMHWHFWLTFGSVLLAAAGFLMFCIVAEKNPGHSLFGPLAITLTLFAASIPIFLGTQLWFAIDLVRALVTVRHS